MDSETMDGQCVWMSLTGFLFSRHPQGTCVASGIGKRQGEKIRVTRSWTIL